jgi:hypothetical protein
VATYRIEYDPAIGACSDPVDPSSAHYGKQQVVMWEREAFDPETEDPTSFGPPELVSRDAAGGSACTFDPDGSGGPQSALMGIGGDEYSHHPSVSRDGSRVSFVDVAGLRAAGYQIPTPTRVTGAYGMAGGGWEVRFPYEVPPRYLEVVSGP